MIENKSMVPDFFKGKRILITGGNGYIAYNIIKLLKDTELKITRFDFRVDDWSEITDGCRIKFSNIKDDIRNQDVLESILPDYDIIFHLAAQTSTYIADSDPVNDININLIPLVRILDICEKKSLNPTIIFSGTATEVGMNDELNVNENFQDRPATIYDLNKLLSETYLNYYCRKGIVKGVTLRLANVYGPGPVSSSKDRGIVNSMIRKALDKTPLTIYGTGEYIRDYIYVDDVARAFCAAAQNIEKINGLYFYIGSGKGNSISGMFQTIKDKVYERTGYSPEIRHVDFPDNQSIIEKRNFIAIIDNFVQNTSWHPEINLRDGIGLTIDYFLKN